MTRKLQALLVTLAFAATARAQNPTAPTIDLPAENLDAQWSAASAKYDHRRAELLHDVDRTNAAGPFHPDWQSLQQYRAPDWFRDAKFGIFIHWGLYAVPAFANEWYPRNMYLAGTPENKHQVATYGPLTQFGYKDFIPLFTAARYDPAAWARLFKQAGARYVIPVFEHHDGFALYDSGLSDWTAVKMGPHRDLNGELANAVRAEGLHLGASNHRVEHDWFLAGGRAQPSDLNDPRFAAFYGPAHPRQDDAGDNLARDWTFVSPAYLDDWLARATEIVEKYHPELLYFDWWDGEPNVRPYLARFAAFFYNQSARAGHPAVLFCKDLAMREGTCTQDYERGQLTDIRARPWQTDTSVSNASWGFVEHDTFKSPDFLVHQLADIVSKNGNLLLNIGPRADGTIPDEVQEVLLAVGKWLDTNGEAIYATRPWRIFGEGPTQVVGGAFHDTETKAWTPQDFRFTTKAGVLYAIQMAWPTPGANPGGTQPQAKRTATIHALASGVAGSARVAGVTLLGTSTPIPFEQTPEGLTLRLPETAPTPYAVTYRITFTQP